MSKLELQKLNEFSKDSLKWDKEFVNFDHFNDFHNCLVHFDVETKFKFLFYFNSSKINYTENEIIDALIDSNIKFNGVTYELIKARAQEKNFIPHFTLYQKNLNLTDDEIWNAKNYKHIYRVHGVETDFSRITTRNFLPKIAHTSLLSLNIIDERYVTNYRFTPPLFSYNYYYLISYNDYYTNYEKLTLPFDVTTRALLIFTFGLTFVSIFGLHQSPKWLSLTFFGRGIRKPAYNEVGIFFGISQLRLPRESFCRALLIIFIWFCLIIRTCWQSMMLEFMTTDMQKLLPASIDDLRKMNYTIVVHNDVRYNYSLTYNQELIDVYNLYNQTINGLSDVKYAFFVSNIDHAELNVTFKNSLPIMEYEGTTKPYGFLIHKNHIFFNDIHDFIDRLIPLGIFQHLADYGFWYFYRPYDVEIKDPRRILMKNFFV
ncbi:hypothetical protein PVAND_001499 [Polypedilum vanderplanki]|uniref:Ionotropic receptor n=1 Tax=Polypedilum vanderplanki TaxID=319348 RepID=A0A9J6BPE2_POLVA|nr:hypothetical protein PVAND_001499 [Polypedilum vanderplanki]